MQWLTDTNRIRPCRLLSSIDTKLLLTELGQEHDLTSLVKSYPFIEWKEVNQEVMGCLQENPTDRATAASVEARLDLVDWCVKNRQGSTPSPVDDRNKIQWLEKHLH